MNKPIIFTHTITDAPAPLTELGRLIGDVDVVADPDNDDPVTISAGDGDVEMAPGQGHVFIGVDLAEITVDGTNGDVLKVVGNTSR